MGEPTAGYSTVSRWTKKVLPQAVLDYDVSYMAGR